MNQRDYDQLREKAKDVAHVLLFVMALAFFGATLLTGNLGFAGVGTGLLAVIGIARA